MVLISHRGNTDGKIPSAENRPDYIDEAIGFGYDVEVDIRYVDGDLYLGHDNPDYPTTLNWLRERSDRLWIHCKNHEAVEHLHQTDFNYFWHDDDDMTLTSHGFIWAHPKIQPLKNSIAVLPDNYDWDLNDCMGICSDYIKKYENIN